MNVLPAVLPTIQVMNPLDVLMSSINTNPYFIGLMMLLLNLGGRFLALEISKEQEKFLSQPLVRRFFLFAILFVATRNIVIAVGLAVIVILILGYLFNENSSMCLWKPCVKENFEQQPQQLSFVGLTPEEAMILKRLQDKQAAAQQQQKETPEQKPETVKNNAVSDMYEKALHAFMNVTKQNMIKHSD
jgi:hypothetical protein